MKIAYLAESPADEAALKILTESILQRKTELILPMGLRHRGWPAVKIALPVVLKNLHYNTDAEGCVLIVDSNGNLPHALEHNFIEHSKLGCRLCQLCEISEETLRSLRPIPGRVPLKIALGLAVPAIESWLLCGEVAQVTEAAWINGLKEKKAPYTKESLKEKIYGTSRPSLALETDKMILAANRLSCDLASLEKLFPAGFGQLVRSLKKW